MELDFREKIILINLALHKQVIYALSCIQVEQADSPKV